MLVRHQGLIKLFKITSVSHTCKKMGDVYNNFVTNLNLMCHLTRKLVSVVQPWARYLEGDNILTKLGRVEIKIGMAIPTF